VSNKRLLALDLGHDRYDRSVQPKHERLRDHLIKEMITGRLKPGQVLPSDRSLMETLGVARTTVRQAMASLENDGLIRRVQGKGTYVETDVRRKLQRGQDIFALVVLETHGGYYPSLLHGFETAAGDIHHQAIICSTGGDVARQADVILQLLDKEVGGVALNPTGQPPTPAYQVRQLQKHGIPVVFCHRRVEGVAAPLLAIPFREIGRLAGKVLAEHGHRRVAYITGPRLPATEEYKEGLQEALRAGGCELPAEAVYTPQYLNVLNEEEVLWPILQQVFAKPDRPTAIFASYDPVAEMIYLLLPRLGLRVPEDVSLIGFGSAWREGALTKRLTSVVVDEIATGQKAVALLHEMRRGERPIDDNEEIVLGLDLSKGETVAEPSGARELV
jgi:DNA-binding LacI/PurR family transcriptional regulator